MASVHAFEVPQSFYSDNLAPVLSFSGPTIVILGFRTAVPLSSFSPETEAEKSRCQDLFFKLCSELNEELSAEHGFDFVDPQTGVFQCSEN